MKRALLLLLITLPAFAQDLSITNFWVKSVPPMAKMSAGYMNIQNNSDKEISLVNAKATIASVVELHTHLKENGVMMMRKVPAIKIPAHTSVELKPKSFHIMFINLTEKLPENKEVQVELEFSNGEKQTLKGLTKKL